MSQRPYLAGLPTVAGMAKREPRGVVADTNTEPSWYDLAHGVLGLLTKLLGALVDAQTGADFWDANTDALEPNVPRVIVQADRFRRRVVITNQGANPMMVSPQKASSMSGQNACRIPAGGNRELRIKGEVYAFSALGTTYDYQDERKQSYDE